MTRFLKNIARIGIYAQFYTRLSQKTSWVGPYPLLAHICQRGERFLSTLRPRVASRTKVRKPVFSLYLDHRGDPPKKIGLYDGYGRYSSYARKYFGWSRFWWELCQKNRFGDSVEGGEGGFKKTGLIFGVSRHLQSSVGGQKFWKHIF